MSGNALLVINIGPNGPGFLSENSRQSFKSACDRWGCEYVEVTSTNAPYCPAILKLKAFDYCKHDRIFILDADTVIRDDAPNPFTHFDPKFFWAVKNQQEHHPAYYKQVNVKLARMQIDMILKDKPIQLKFDPDQLAQNFFNSGVVIAERQSHEHVLAMGYWLLLNIPGLGWWDQVPINVAVSTLLGGHSDMGPHWNLQFPGRLDTMSAFIYHFSGNPERYKILEGVNWHHG